MTQVTVQHATEHIPSLIEAALHGEEIFIVQGDAPVVKLTPIAKTEAPATPQARFGSGKGLLRFMAPDFDALLENFTE